jgi:hypothetical protein
MSSKYFQSIAKTNFIFSMLVLTTWLMFGCSRNAPDPGPESSSKRAAAPAPAPPPPVLPAGPEELALLAPLVVGSSLADYEVAEIHAVRKGVIELVCRKDRANVRLSIALAADKGPEPPARADTYAIYYSLRNADPAEAERLAKALAEIVGKHLDVPVPKGLTEFVPAGIPL